MRVFSGATKSMGVQGASSQIINKRLDASCRLLVRCFRGPRFPHREAHGSRAQDKDISVNDLMMECQVDKIITGRLVHCKVHKYVHRPG